MRNIWNEATPEEAGRLTEGTAQHILGEGRRPDPKGIIKRFNEIADDHSGVLEKMFGSGPFSHADTWGDLPRMQQAAENNIRDPALKGSWIDGWQQATQNTPEARELADRLAEYRQLPSQAQAELTGQREAVSSRGSARDILSAQRYWLMRQIAFAPLGVGMAAHHPALAMAMGGIWFNHDRIFTT